MENNNELEKTCFQSLSLLGIDWKTAINKNSILKQKYTELLKLKEDWIIVEEDFSQLEVYVLAAVSKDPKLISACNSGKDLHNVNCETIYNISLEKFETQLKNAKNEKEKTEAEYLIKDFKTKRKAIKALTFSLLYGAGKEKIAMDLRISEEEAQKLISSFYTTYPLVRKWQGDNLLHAIQNGYIITNFGRRRATPKVKGRIEAYKAFIQEDKKTIIKLKKEHEYWSLREEFKTVLNSCIQSLASDMCSLAAIKYKEWIKKANVRCELYFWVHDSIVMACHVDDAIVCIEKLSDLMENKVKYQGDPVNYRTSLAVGRNYEWVSEIKREDWITGNKEELLRSALDKSIKSDLEKHFKLIVKSTSSDLTNQKEYLNKVKDTKSDYFEYLVGKLGIENVWDPASYMSFMNGVSKEEYLESMELENEDSEY